jgi:hypothetical protein
MVKRVTIMERVLPLLKEGMPAWKIALRLKLKPIQVYAAIRRIRYPDVLKERQRAYGAKRYGTEGYRQYMREYVHRRYHNEPAFKAQRLAAVKRFRDKAKEASP